MKLFGKTFGTKDLYASLLFGQEGSGNLAFDGLLSSINQYFNKSQNLFENVNLGRGVKLLSLTGLSSMHRVGNAILSKADDNHLMVDGKVAFDALTIETYVEKQIWWWIWFLGKVHTDIPKLQIHTKVLINQSEEENPKLQSLHVKGWTHFSTKITDGNWLGTILSWFPWIPNSMMRTTLPEKIKSGSEEILKQFKFKFP